jgi:hypothetical protein
MNPSFNFQELRSNLRGQRYKYRKERETRRRTERKNVHPFQPTLSTSSNICLFNDRVSNRNEAEPPPLTWLAIPTNDQWDYGDRLNEHLNLQSDAIQPGACAVHFDRQISCCRVNYKNRVCCVIIRVTSLLNT